jgi:hypothetical protein
LMTETQIHRRAFTRRRITSGKGPIHPALVEVNIGYHFPAKPVPKREILRRCWINCPNHIICARDE